jgi:hypothetical protein
MLVHGVVFDQGLHRDIALGIPVPVGRKAAGLFVIAVTPAAELIVVSVERIGFPARIGAVEVGIVLEHVEQDRVDLVAAKNEPAFSFAQLEDLCHRARGVQRNVEFGLQDAGLGSGYAAQAGQSVFLHLTADAAADQRLGVAGRIDAIAHGGNDRRNQAGSGNGGNLVLDRCELHCKHPHKLTK